MQEFELPVEPGSVAAARAAMADFNLPEPPLANATLLLSELVTNAVVHAEVEPGATLTWRVETNGLLRIEVCDPGKGFSLRPRDRAMDQPGGWGLVLVDKLAERWGIEREHGQTCVWFEFPVER